MASKCWFSKLNPTSWKPFRIIGWWWRRLKPKAKFLKSTNYGATCDEAIMKLKSVTFQAQLGLLLDGGQIRFSISSSTLEKKHRKLASRRSFNDFSSLFFPATPCSCSLLTYIFRMYDKKRQRKYNRRAKNFSINRNRWKLFAWIARCQLTFLAVQGGEKFHFQQVTWWKRKWCLSSLKFGLTRWVCRGARRTFEVKMASEQERKEGEMLVMKKGKSRAFRHFNEEVINGRKGGVDFVWLRFEFLDSSILSVGADIRWTLDWIDANFSTNMHITLQRSNESLTLHLSQLHFPISTSPISPSTLNSNSPLGFNELFVHRLLINLPSQIPCKSPPLCRSLSIFPEQLSRPGEQNPGTRTSKAAAGFFKA